jgi:hypothetical protein
MNIRKFSRSLNTLFIRNITNKSKLVNLDNKKKKHNDNNLSNVSDFPLISTYLQLFLPTMLMYKSNKNSNLNSHIDNKDIDIDIDDDD